MAKLINGSTVGGKVIATKEEVDQHKAEMAQHNQFMDGAQKKQLVFGINKTLNCLTIEEVTI